MARLLADGRLAAWDGKLVLTDALRESGFVFFLGGGSGVLAREFIGVDGGSENQEGTGKERSSK